VVTVSQASMRGRPPWGVPWPWLGQSRKGERLAQVPSRWLLLHQWFGIAREVRDLVPRVGAEQVWGLRAQWGSWRRCLLSESSGGVWGIRSNCCESGTR
jgi:hypothetical protein